MKNFNLIIAIVTLFVSSVSFAAQPIQKDAKSIVKAQTENIACPRPILPEKY
jgi:hypothetical protein